MTYKQVCAPHKLKKKVYGAGTGWHSGSVQSLEFAFLDLFSCFTLSSSRPLRSFQASKYNAIIQVHEIGYLFLGIFKFFITLMAVNSGSIKENAIFDLIKFEPILKTYFYICITRV